MRVLLVRHISKYCDDRMTKKAKVEGDFVDKFQIVLKRESFAYLAVVDSHQVPP